MSPEKLDFFTELLGWAELQPTTPALTAWLPWARHRLNHAQIEFTA